MPRIYHGIVKRKVIVAIRSKYGSVFGGVSPDIYSAVLISLEAKKIFQIDAPFIIPGGSPVSTAGQGAARTDRANLYDTEHIRRFGVKLQWSASIPEYYAPHNVWAYSMLEALNKASLLSVKPNSIRLIIKSMLADRRYFMASWRALVFVVEKDGISASTRMVMSALLREFLFLVRRITGKLFTKTVSIGNLNDIGIAIEKLESFERQSEFKLSEKLQHSVMVL